MPELTGVPILDFFIWLAAIFAAAVPFAVAVMKFFDAIRGKKKEDDPKFGRRAEDVADLDKRVTVVEVKVDGLEDKVDEQTQTIETHRKEGRENFQTAFKKIDDVGAAVGKIANAVARIERNGSGDGGG
jgi:seryl-tRNA synthetase